MIHRDWLVSRREGHGNAYAFILRPRLQKEMELRGLEPLTSWVRSRRSPS